MATRSMKLDQYEQKYGDIPKDLYERLDWMIDKYHITSNKMNEIINKKVYMEDSLMYYRLKIVLYEPPEGAKRPRFRFNAIAKDNYMEFAMASPHYIHVYSPNAADDNRYLHRLIDKELIDLRWFVQTPCCCRICAYIRTPSVFNNTDIFLAEIGLHRPISTPDWDNIGKKYCDMFNKNVWLDDSLVTDGSTSKYYSILPRIEIFVDYLNYATNIHQYRTITNKAEYKEEYPIDYLDKNGRPTNA